MAQNVLTVTNPNPTPPTNFINTGATPPNPPTYQSTVYGADVYHQPQNQYPPQYDDGTAASLVVFAANAAAIASGGPAATSVPHEGAGTETLFTAPGSNAAAPTQSVGDGPAYSTTPNANHASYLSGGAAPTITSLSAGGASGIGYNLLTVTGTGFNRSSVVNVNGKPQNTNYVSPTSLTVANAPKAPAAGNVPVTVTNGSNQTTAPTNWVFT